MLGILKLHAFVLFGLSVTSCAQISPALLSSADRSTIIESEEFKIIIHAQGGANPNSALKVAKGASAVADSIWGTLRKPQKSPHEIHVWPDKRDYQRAEAKLTQRKFRSNLAFSHYPSRTAHVALNPSTALPSVKKWGLPVQTLRLIAHEAFHLATFERVKSSRWLPDWFSEGLASFAEQRVLETSGFAPDNELLDPWASTSSLCTQVG